MIATTGAFPNKFLDDGLIVFSDRISNWYAAHNALIASMQRQDYTMDTITSDSGSIKITLLEDVVTLYSEVIAVGDSIYVYKNGAIDKTVKVVSVSAPGSPTEITTDEPYAADASGGFINFVSSRKSYYVEIAIYRFYGDIAGIVDPPTNAVVARRKDFPDTTGKFSIDLMGSIRRIVNWNDDFQYDFVNLKDENVSAPLALQFRESWEGNRNQSWSGFDTDLYFNIGNSAMQLRNKGGSNLINYVPDPKGLHKGQFLSNFVRPTYWKDYPFDLQFIYPINFSAETDILDDDGLPLVKRWEQPKKGSTDIGLNDKLLDWEGLGYINRMLLRGNYETDYPGSDSVDVWLGFDGLGDTERYVDKDYVDEGYVDGSGAVDPILFTEKMNVKLAKCVRNNPVYLKWLGFNGSWNYWLFQVNQTRNIKTASLGEISKFISNLEVADTVTDYTGKSADPSLVMGVDNVDSNDIDGLETLFISPKALMLYNPDSWETDGPKWVTVRVIPANKTIRQTKAVRHKFEIEVLLPELNLQMA